MQPWTHLSELYPESWFPAELEAARVQLNERIRQQLQTREQFDAWRERINAASVKTVSADEVFQADCPQHNEFVILQAEDQLREALEAWYQQWNQARRVELERAIQVPFQLEKELRAGLVKLGYIDTSEVTVPGRIEPGFILKHNGIRQAKSYVDQLRNDHQQIRNLNRDAWQQVIDRLELLKRRAVGL